ncbi:HNH endonuclease signature motif containing protein [Corynebacterium felinum]|uniref:HNH nuclease domain-containing protein n=1 Tax=Corynebacterium felinum TaxID=131318 RepID=A0ABU2BCK3_9CORY|nr:HNH endonuclease signature motif containing protein [Corynebacterium felinum]MDF5821994.1 HNH endonuclease signature motif containing protein [Corynebacterium felinum]MDR7355709.1 hypothetical protein [Corynebacterium felinum]
MSSIQTMLRTRAAQEAVLLSEMAAHQLTAADIADWAELSQKQARRLLWVIKKIPVDVLHANTTYGLGFSKMDIIASALNKCRDENANLSELGLRMLDHGRTVTCDELKQHAEAMMEEVNANHFRPHRARLAFNRTPNANDQLFFQGAGPSTMVAEMESILVAEAHEYRAQRPDQGIKLSQALFHVLYNKVCAARDYDALLAAQFSAGETPTTDHYLPYRPCYVLVLDPTYRYHADGKAMTTDGSLIPLKELAEQQLNPLGYAVVYALSEGGDYEHVATYGTRRFFTDHQRFVGALETPLCAHPACDRKAVNCQAHHIHAWARGGETLQTNMVPLCAEHNGLNDDLSDVVKHGRIERCPKTGIPGLRRRPGEPLDFNLNPLMRKGIRKYLAELRWARE